MELFKLVGKIFVDSAEAENSISKTDKKADGLGSKLASGIKTAAKWGAGIAGAATAVGGAMVAAAKSTADAADAIDKASIRMGIDAETYQELAYAAGLSGVEVSTLEEAAKKLGGTDLNLDDAINQLMSIPDAGERSKAAIDLFGESAYKMTPLLESGAEGLQAMRDEAHELGIVMSGEAVKNGAAMGDMFSKVEQSAAALKNGLMSELMPYVMEILQWVIDNIPMIKDTVDSVMSAIMPIVKPILNAIMALLPPLLKAVKGFIDWLTPYITPIIEGLSAFIGGILSLIDGDVSGFIDGIKTLLTNFISTAVNLGKDIFGGLWDGIKSVWSSISGWVSEKVGWIKDKLTFWKKSNDQMQPDGSHAAGLAFVPYDGYVAELHRGETVLNSTDASNLLDEMKRIAGSQTGGVKTINLSIELDGDVLARKMYSYNTAEETRRGQSLVNA